MKKSRKTLSLLLTLAMVATLIPALALPALAADTEVDITGTGVLGTIVQDVINDSEPGDTVTVTGARTGMNTASTLNIPAGVTVVWAATGTGTGTTVANAALTLTGGGTFVLVTGGSVASTGANANARAINVTGPVEVIIDGGTVQANTGVAISIGTGGSVTVADGLVTSAGTTAANGSIVSTGAPVTISGDGTIVRNTASNANGHAITATGATVVTVLGGEVRTGGLGAAINANAAATSVIVDGGLVTSARTATNSGAIYSTGTVTVLGGTVENTAANANARAIYNTGTVNINGGTVRATGATTVTAAIQAAGAALNITAGTVSAAGAGNAILVSGASTRATLTGGTVTSNTGAAVSATGTSAVVYIDGAAVTGGAFTAGGANAIIIERTATVYEYVEDTDTDLSVTGAGAAAAWLTPDKITYTRNTNTGVITVEGVTVSLPDNRMALDISGKHTFQSMPYGYDTLPAALSVTVTNTGALETGGLTVALSGANAGSFELSDTAIGSIPAGGNAVFTVAPILGLEAGIHTATVTVSGDNGLASSFSLSINVIGDGPVIISEGDTVAEIQANIADALSITNPGDIVTILGSKMGAGATTLNINIPAYVQVMWCAAYAGTGSPVIQLSGSGLFIAAEGGSIAVTSGAGTALNATGSVNVAVLGAVIMNQGTGIAINIGNSGSVTVSAGLVTSARNAASSGTIVTAGAPVTVNYIGIVTNTATATNNGYAVIYASAAAAIRVDGGEVSARGEMAPMAINANNAGCTVTVTGGLVSANRQSAWSLSETISGVILTSGTVTIEGGIVECTKGSHVASCAIVATGSNPITVNGGIVRSISTNPSVNGNGCAIRTNNAGNVIINGGEVYSDGGYAIWTSNANGAITINDGYVHSANYAAASGSYIGAVASASTVTVNGGTVENTSENANARAIWTTNNTANAVKMTDGTVIANGAGVGIQASGASAMVTITGGVVTADTGASISLTGADTVAFVNGGTVNGNANPKIATGGARAKAVVKTGDKTDYIAGSREDLEVYGTGAIARWVVPSTIALVRTNTTNIPVAVYNYTVSAKDFAITLDRSGVYTFPAATYLYDTLPAPVSVGVENIGIYDTGELNVTLTGANPDCFELSTDAIADIAVGGAASLPFTVTPKIGLPAGTYTATVTVSGDYEIIATFYVSFTVRQYIPGVSWPTGLTTLYGNILSDIALPGNGASSVPGTFTWTAPGSNVGNPSTSTPAQPRLHNMTFTPDDENYAIMNENVPVMVTNYGCDCLDGCECMPPDDMLNLQYSDAWSTHATGNVFNLLQQRAAERNQMDLYFPKTTGRGTVNVLLVLHGGGWTAGDKRDQLSAIADQFLAAKGDGIQDYVIVNMNYRFAYGTTSASSPPANSPNAFDMLDDIQAALEMTAKILEDNGYTPGVLAISGISSGGHLTSLYGFTRGVDIRGTGPEPASPIPIALLLPIAGPANIHFMPQEIPRAMGIIHPNTVLAEGQKLPEPQPLFTNLARNLPQIGPVYTAWNNNTKTLTQEASPTAENMRRAAASPISYVSADSPPTLIWHGINDSVVPVNNAQALYWLLEQAGVRTNLYTPVILGQDVAGVPVAHSSVPEDSNDPLHFAYMAELHEWITELFVAPADPETVTSFNGHWDGDEHGITVNHICCGVGTVKFMDDDGLYTLDACPTFTDVGVYTVYFEATRLCGQCTPYQGSGTVTIYYTVTFDVDGELTEVYVPGTTVERPADPVKPGYMLVGWIDSEGELFDFDTVLTGDITLTAVFEEIYITSAVVKSFNTNLQNKNNNNLEFVVTVTYSDGTAYDVSHAEKVNGGQKGNKTFTYDDYTVYAAWNDNNKVTTCEVITDAPDAGSGKNNKGNQNSQ